MQELRGKLKNLKVHTIAKDILYAKQKNFKYRDTPGKQLAHLLAEPRLESNYIPLRRVAGGPRDISRKVETFAHYYQAPCKSSEVDEVMINRLFSDVNLPVLIEEH